MGIIKFSGWYSPELCQEHPEILFVFGDNLMGFGMGGQAVIRNQENAFGVPTKRRPSMAPGSFFEEDSATDLDAVLDALKRLWGYLRSGKTVVIPVTGDGQVSLGLERAELKQRAPSIYNTIVLHIEEMCKNYGERYAGNTVALGSH